MHSSYCWWLDLNVVLNTSCYVWEPLSCEGTFVRSLKWLDPFWSACSQLENISSLLILAGKDSLRVVYYGMHRHIQHFWVQLLASNSFQLLSVRTIPHSLAIYPVWSHPKITIVTKLLKVVIHFWGLQDCNTGFKSVVWIKKRNKIFLLFLANHVLDVGGCCLSRACIAGR